MEILRSIALYAENKSMPFIVIGGHAINAHGYSRQTGDIDILVIREQKLLWLELMEKLKYTKGQDDDRFARFKPDQIAAWPIDMMFVDEQTFDKMKADAKLFNFGHVQALLVSAEHLAILKLHALKHYQPHRSAKDYGDLLELLRSNRAVFSKDTLKTITLKYATIEIYEKLCQDLKL